MKRNLMTVLGVAAAALLSACAAPVAPYDYSALKESNPRSILVLPPVNESPDVRAFGAVMASATAPLAESGYYVFPAAVVYETFKQNGLSEAEEVHKVPLAKLNEIFHPDAVLYLNVTDYGTKYQIIQSDTRVGVQAKLVDGKTGKLLWQGAAQASTTEQQSHQGLLSMLVTAVVEQIASNLTDRGFDMAQVATARLLHAGGNQKLLYGPYSPRYHGKQNAGAVAK